MHKNLFLAITMTVGAVALVAGSGVASAAPYGDTSPIYVGGGLGRTEYDIRCRLADKCNLHKTGSGKLYAGFSFAPSDVWHGVQLVSSLEAVAYQSGEVALNGRYQSIVAPLVQSFRGAGLVYKGSIRAGESLSVHGRVGVSHTWGKMEYKGRPPSSATFGRTAPTAGVGLSYALDRQWSLNADYDRLKVKFDGWPVDTVHMMTLGAGYKF